MPTRKAHKQSVRGTPLRTTDRVYTRLLDLISTGRFEPGDRVKIRDMVDALRVSATPVREAIALLVRDGVLTFEPNKGASVRTYSPDEMTELFELRAVLEGLAARRAALSPRRDNLVRTLRDQIVLMRDAIRRLDRPDYNRCDLAFHEAIFAEGSAGLIRESLRTPQLLSRVFSAMADEDRRTIPALKRSDRKTVAEFKRGVKHHTSLLDAIASADADHAERVAREHALRFIKSGLGIPAER